MKRVFRVKNATIAAALAFACVSGVASAKGNNGKAVVATDAWRVAEAKGGLLDIRDLADKANTNAAVFKATLRGNNVTDLQLERQQLNELRGYIKDMGTRAVALQNDRDNLAGWERDALDHVLPLLRDTASNLNETLRFTRDNPTWMGTPANLAHAEAIENDSHQIAKTIDEYLKYAKTVNRP